MPAQLALAILLLAPQLPGEPLRRLTHSQYNNAVRDLLADQTRPADHFPPEDFVDGFRNQARAQSISPLLAEAYGAAAEKLARNAFRGGDTNKLIPCRPSGPSDAACAGEFVKRFGLRVYRRPLTARETQRFVNRILQSGDFLKGAQAVVETMLQSPNFLFRVEREGSPYATASRLAFFLWNTPPDEALLAEAARGDLNAAGTARRMLADPRARQALDDFLSQWLRFDLLAGTVKDRRQFPQFTPELAEAMAEETRLLIHPLVWEDRDFTELFTARYAFVNSDLARLYRLPAPPSEFARVDFPATSDRAGLLGQGTFLALTSKPGDTSPTARGLFVRDHLLCQTIPDPPPGTNSTLPEVTADQPRANRDRLAEHVGNPVCRGCHQMIDPVGFAFEKFDAIGQRREKLKLTFYPQFGKESKSPKPETAEVELDTRGTLMGMGAGPAPEFSSPTELGRLLAASPICQECIVKQLFRYALGRRETAADQPAIDAAVETFRRSQFRFRELMIAVATTERR